MPKSAASSPWWKTSGTSTPSPAANWSGTGRNPEEAGWVFERAGISGGRLSGEGGHRMSKGKTTIIEVQGTDITILSREQGDFISLTDMVKNFDGGNALIEQWLKNKDTVLFLGIWEQLNNPVFNSLEFEGIKNRPEGTASICLPRSGSSSLAPPASLPALAAMAAPMPTRILPSNLAPGSAPSSNSTLSRNSSVSKTTKTAVSHWHGISTEPCRN